MKKTFITIIMLAAFAVAKAQTTDTAKQNQQRVAKQHRMDSLRNMPFDQKIFTAVQQEPEFVGGTKALHKYLKANLKYPQKAVDENISGEVLLSFVVEKDGSLSDIKVIRGLSRETDYEAIRLLENCPKWKPGMQNGTPCRVQYSLPINF